MNKPVSNVEASLASAMAAAFSEISAATKAANNPHFKTKYADLTSVIEAIKPALSAHGLFFVQCPEPSDKGVTIKTVLHHSSGESLVLGTLFVPANKQDAQGYGSALTYARRYALVTAFGVPVEDDDGNAAVKSQAQAPIAETMPDAVRVKIVQLCEAVGGNQAKLICEAHKISAIPELTAKQAEAVIARLEEKLAAKAKAETDAKAREDA